MDSLDAVTSLAGLVDAARRKQPGNLLAPVMVGIVLYNSGSIYRLLDERSRGKATASFLYEPGSGVSRGVVMALLYWYLGHGFCGGQQRNKALVALTIFYILFDLFQDATGVDAFANAHKPMLSCLSALHDHFQLGPRTCRLESTSFKQTVSHPSDDSSMNGQK
eukprot:CAMPEP_0197701874 /NCGR_PEP_ID=MMETSP1338-20131121/123805_1 /TAXON_ID=43686 ORGANISM="Pelagodinium beii, Strain RCC1491" /NCGR_SAMPLE_ID=MMETSP1338 /ASSEMBLY_ACC=CAM_ASM_000754 /LENGTH=163 /DNA_ID=CAMNT_0043285633 /DNA_START=400 /DNA_END=891 /DNA_ORIENTATION=+